MDRKCFELIRDLKNMCYGVYSGSKKVIEILDRIVRLNVLFNEKFF